MKADGRSVGRRRTVTRRRSDTGASAFVRM
jgi:hypothetical protein